MATLKGFPPSNIISTGGPISPHYIIDWWNKNGLLDVVATTGEKMVLAVILESRFCALNGCVANQYQKYREIIGDLHDHHFHHCMHLAAKISDEDILRTEEENK